jgi:hypothetical protein
VRVVKRTGTSTVNPPCSPVSSSHCALPLRESSPLSNTRRPLAASLAAHREHSGDAWLGDNTVDRWEISCDVRTDGRLAGELRLYNTIAMVQMKINRAWCESPIP